MFPVPNYVRQRFRFDNFSTQVLNTKVLRHFHILGITYSIPMKSKMILIVGISLLGVSLPAYAQNQTASASNDVEFPITANETTLSIVVTGGIAGAFMRNVTGYLGEKKKQGNALKWRPSDLGRTALFAIPVGTLTSIGFTSLLDVDVGNSFVQGFVLFWMVVALTVGFDKIKKDTT